MARVGNTTYQALENQVSCCASIFLKKSAAGGNNVNVLECVRKKLASFILLNVDQLCPAQGLGEFGIDSMLTAGCWSREVHALEIDVPLIMLRDSMTTADSLPKFIFENLAEKQME